MDKYTSRRKSLFLFSPVRTVLSRLTLTVLALALTSFVGCKNTTGPDFFEVNVVAYNNSGVAVDIYLDGTFKISVEAWLSGTITGVSNGTHLFDVKQKGTAILIESVPIDIKEKNEYTWYIDGPSSIKITNNSGVTLQLYSGNNHMGDLNNQESQSITDVPFGDHVLTAVRLSDQVVVATTTITVDEVKEYTWVVTS